MVYHEQYSRYVGMVEETLERVLPQSEAVFSGENGVPVCSGAQLAAGDFVNMRFADGAALAQIMDHSGKEDSCGG